MRTIAFFIFFLLVAVQGFAQRDLFAEFEAEIDSATKSENVVDSLNSEALNNSDSLNIKPLTVDSTKVDSTDINSMNMDSLIDSTSSDSIKVEKNDSVKTDSLIQDSLNVDSAEIAKTIEIKDSTQLDSILSDDSLSSSSMELSSSSDPLIASSSSSESLPPSSSSMSRRDLLGPVKVSKVYGMDDMKGRYKSPRKAMFMSMVIPGSGQLYVGGSTFTNVRGVAYLALEAALWGSWYYFTIYKYDKQVDKYKKFAKNHFSIGRYESYMRDIYLNQLADETEESRFETRYMSSREDFCKAIYGDASASGCYTKGKLFTNDKAHTDRFSINNPVSLGNEIKSQKNFYDMSSIYQHISDKSYVLGWDDVDSIALGQNLLLEEDNIESVVPLGNSKNLSKYRSMRSKANDYADMQIWFFGGIILNHLISAVDAAFTANAHNKELYSEDLSWYDRLHFESYMSFFDGFDIGVQASWGF